MFKMKKLLRKSIEIYDENWSSHYVSPIGFVISWCGIISTFLIPFLEWYAVLGTILFFIGSYIGVKND